MLFAARVPITKAPAAFTFINLYSTISGLARRNWRTGSHPAPQSLIQDEHEQLSAEDDAEEQQVYARPSPIRHKPSKIPTPREFVTYRDTLKKAFPEGWSPPRKLSREAMDGLRSMHASHPDIFTTPVLAEKFRVSPEAVRRILKSKWEPTRERRVRLAERERRKREEWIRQNREEERRLKNELEKLNPRPTSKNDRLTLT
ncbi:hypothetical protein AcW1_009518 [Taiwanofungus camphoratus]|nr:hypothetical protein AcV7_002684 [Antrodia cinnamomea]KAI0947868.1 hypothetical protein AcW1_009518 [Antrodia cinnamomea]